MTQSSTPTQKHVLVIERETGPVVMLRYLLSQAGIEMTQVYTISEARGLLAAGWPFTGIIVQGWSEEQPHQGSSIENTLGFLRDLELAKYPGKLYVLSSTDFDNPAFREAAPNVLTNVYDKNLVFNGQQPLEF